VIAGGRSSRFGSDKALALLAGRPLIDHAIVVLRPHVGRIVVCGREWGGLTALADPAPNLGPLGGFAAALTFAEAEGFESVLTIGCDMPEVPDAVIAGLLDACPAYCGDAPILGHWPSSLAAMLLGHISPSSAGVTARSGKQSHLSIRRWADTIGACAVPAPGLRNINTPADLT
jgi:molybdopterin-guanine dinucleotide biosynthesis protein A